MSRSIRICSGVFDGLGSGCRSQFTFMNSAVRLGTFAFLIPLLLSAENWPRFRGSGGQGHSSETNLPIQWSSTENVRWRTTVPGSGWSSPVVWGDHVVVTSTTDEDRSCRVICIDARGGKIVWNREVFRQEQASRTLPSVDGGFEWETVYSI